MSKRLFFVISVYLILIFIGYYAYVKIIVSNNEKKEQTRQLEEKSRILNSTGSDSVYDYQLNFALDSFTGYCVIRSEKFKSELASRKIHLNLVDDGADYDRRIKSIADGNCAMAAFPIDALIKTSSKINSLPATIVCLIDETKGADAMVSYQEAVPNIDALNHPDTKFILTKNSPSETLVRVLMANFILDKLSDNAFHYVNDASEVYKLYRQAQPNTRQVFVLWEPFVSKVLENPNTHVVIDSSRFQGYIADAIVCNREFLVKNPDEVRKVIESYFYALNYYKNNNFNNLIMEDSAKTGTPLSEEQVKNIFKGIWWKNTQENYVHFGLIQNRLQHIQSIIENLIGVLLKSKAISSDPTHDQANMLYYDKILNYMLRANFYPGSTPDRISDIAVLPKISDEEWSKLITIGTLEVPSLVFLRGTYDLTDRSRLVLNDLIKSLNTFPQYYVLVKGGSTGNIEAGKKLALARAKSAAEYLMQNGIPESRIKATSFEAVDQTTGSASVKFVLGQPPF